MPEAIRRLVLRLPGYEVRRSEFDEGAPTVTLWVKQVGAGPFHTCHKCGIGTRRLHGTSERRVRDLTTLTRHLEGILNYCRHKVPFGVVEPINANIRSMIRRGRGYRDHKYLILKVRKSTAQARLERAA